MQDISTQEMINFHTSAGKMTGLMLFA